MARRRWVTLGDKNTRFFHQATLTRRCRNRVMALKDVADNWVFEEDALRKLVHDFYTTLFTSFGIMLGNYDTCNSFPFISLQDMDMLRQDVSFEETGRPYSVCKISSLLAWTDFTLFSSNHNGMSLGILFTILFEDVLQIRGPFRELTIPFSLHCLSVMILFM